jgi:hypothetical protein
VQLYVKINGTKVVYNGKPEALTRILWTQWNVDLSSMGGNLGSVGSLTIGVSGSGKGTLYIDDVRLYRSAPAVVQPVDPGTTGLSAYYAMDGDMKDSSGHGYNGTLVGDPVFVDAPTGFGKALQFDGVNDYVELSITPLLGTLTNATFAVRINVDSTGGAWTRIFDFGTGETVNMFLTPDAGGPVRFAITTSGSGGESQATSSGSLAPGWHHVAAVIDGVTMTMQLYVDGEMADSGETTVLPSTLGATTQNWLGRSEYPDPYYMGAMDEFRIYNRVLSAGEVRYLAGDR